MKPILSIGFRRSGNHLLIATIKKNFDVPIHIHGMAHPAPDLHSTVLLRRFLTLVYPYRECVPVMKSLHKFFLTSGFKNWDGVNVIVPKDFEEFLAGGTLIKNCWCPTMRRIFEDPIREWEEHKQFLKPLTHNSCRGERIYSVKYENLVANPEEEILRISKHFGWRLRYDKPVSIKKRVGP